MKPGDIVSFKWPPGNGAMYEKRIYEVEEVHSNNVYLKVVGPPNLLDFPGYDGEKRGTLTKSWQGKQAFSVILPGEE